MKKIIAIHLMIIVSGVGNWSYGQLWKQYADSAKGFKDQKEPDRAITYYNKAREILLKDSAYSNAFSQICINIADLYNSTGEQKKIVLFYLESRDVIEKAHGKINVAYANITDRLGQFYASRSPSEAEKYMSEAKDIREKEFGDQSLEYATSCNNLGNIYISTGQYQKAEYLNLHAKKIREVWRPKEDPAYAQSCNNLANIYWRTGEYEKAEGLALEAKKLRELILPAKGSPPYAITCTLLGNLYRDMGQYGKAEEFYLEAKQIRQTTLAETDNNYAESFIILADLYSYMGKYDKAEPLYLEVRKIREKTLTKESSAYALICNNLGDLYSNMGNYEKAEALLVEAKEIWNRVLDTANTLHAYNRNSLGQLYFLMGQYSKAQSCFLDARQRWERSVGKEHPNYIQNTNNLARLAWVMNKPGQADALYSQAFLTQFDLINKAFQFTSEAEKSLYIKNIIGSSDEYYSFYYKKKPLTAAAQIYSISLQNRNLILSSVQQMKQTLYNSRDTALIGALNEWTRSKAQLAHMYSQALAKPEQVKEAKEKADNKEKELSKLSFTFAKLQRKITWQEIQQHLGKNEAAIEFISFNLFDGRNWNDSVLYAALILKPGQAQPVMVPLFEKRQFDRLLKQNSDDEISTVNKLYTSTKLFDLIWRPIEKYLEGISKIYYAPAGDLFRISFSAIPINATTLLIDKYRLVQLNTTATAGNSKDDFIAATDKIELYGGIEYDADSTTLKLASMAYHKRSGFAVQSFSQGLSRGNSFDYLPGTLDEVDGIKKQADKARVSANVLSGIHASEESFDSLTGAASPAILHIATHGFFLDDPATLDSLQRRFQTSGTAFRQSDDPLMRSGLLFSGANNTWRGRYVNGIEDGIATAYEISIMYLPNTRMVVLSACQTALGTIKGSEGVYGLQRAFKMAGVQNLVMSLWKVPDRETSEFMQAFYSNLFAKQSINSAFDHARTKMKNTYRHEPYKWAAWVLIR